MSKLKAVNLRARWDDMSQAERKARFIFGDPVPEKMSRGKLHRAKFCGDKPATEKQIAYLRVLLKAKQARAEAGKKMYIHFFWAWAKIPADLTFWEAKHLIDIFIRGNIESVYEMTIDAIKMRLQQQDDERYTSEDRILSLLAFKESAKFAHEKWALKFRGKHGQVLEGQAADAGEPALVPGLGEKGR